MTLAQIFVFALLSLLVGRLTATRTRSWILFVTNLFAVFWLQPQTSLRHFDFWFPAATIALIVLTWFIVRERSPLASEDKISLAVIVSFILLISFTRLLPQPLIIPTYPPQTQRIVLTLLVAMGVIAVFALARRERKWIIPAMIAFIVLLLVVLKSESLQLDFSRVLRRVMGQSPALASQVDITWLGYSYITFRLIHTLRLSAMGKLPALTLRELLTFGLFYPALTAGPIDRVERFLKDLRRFQVLTADRFMQGGKRIAIGMFKKFVLADSLAILALNEVKAGQVSSPAWLWLLLYAFALQIYLDFSGYTDLALGIGFWAGIKLPENFDRPYLQTDIGAFWNRWHITLTHWFRFYVFNPLTRSLRTLRMELPVWTIILTGQLFTMVLIGMWHGITWHFILWGLWNGAGLFFHNRWVLFHQKYWPLSSTWRENPFSRAVGIFITFNYIALGWVWFAIPNVDAAFEVMRKLIGI
jgi:alginate O-acetyltransferase complex protein AlgI